MRIKLSMSADILYSRHSGFSGCSSKGIDVDGTPPDQMWGPSPAHKREPTTPYKKMQDLLLDSDGRLAMACGDERFLEEALLELRANPIADERVTMLRVQGKAARLMTCFESEDIAKAGLPKFLFKPLTAKEKAKFFKSIGNPSRFKPDRGYQFRVKMQEPYMSGKILAEREQVRLLDMGGSLVRKAMEDSCYDKWSVENRRILPYWWEVWDAMNKARPTAKELVDKVAGCVFMRGRQPRTEHYFISGSCWFSTASDSCNFVTALAMSNPSTLVPHKKSYFNTTYGRMYCKVLPYYYHSPQHTDHRMMAAFLSTKPMTLEEYP